VANYNVDIELAIRGSEKAAQQIKKLEKAINDIQRKAAVDLGGQVRLKGEQRLLREKIKNFQISRQELKNSQEIARLTSQRIKGLSQYASTIGPQVDRIAQAQKRAAQEQIQSQQRYNKLVDETLAKLSRIAEVNRKASQYASPIGPPRGGVTQYLGPIGPGAASQANVPQGPFSPLPSRPRRRAGAGGPGGGLAAGIGFPLLFGSGPASTLGGAGGSAFGFGGQILGSALGGQLDQLQERANNLAKALRGVGSIFDALEATVGGVDDETKRYIQNLENSGQKTKAAALAADVLAEKIGVKNAEAFISAGQAADGASEALKNVGTVLVSLSERFRRAGENPTGLTPNGVLDLLPPQFRPAPPTPIEDTPEFKNRTTDLKTALELEKLLTAEKKAQGGVDEKAIALASEAVVKKQAQIEKDLIARDLKDKKIDKEQEVLKIAAVQERLDQRLLDIAERRLNAAERKRKEDEADARRAERERRQRERDLQRREDKENQTLKTINSLIISNNEIGLQSVQIAHGEEVALEQQAASLFEKFRILEKNVELSTEDARVKDLQLQKLNLQKQLESSQISSKQRSLQVEKAITAEKQKQTLAAIGTDIGRQIQDANFRSTGDSAQDTEIALRINQIRRQEDATTRLTNAIKEQQIIINNPPNADAAMRAEEQRQSLQDQLDLYNQLLPQLDAAEQAQLKFNQALEAAKPFADAFTSGLLDGMVAVVDGTKTAEQAFADFLNSIAKMLLQTAQQMIAQYIALGVARMFAGVPSASSGTDTSFMGGSFNPLNFVAGPFSQYGTRALGGSVTGNRPYLVGERGPELFVPGAQGNIVPNNAMGSASVTVNVDASGSSVEGDGRQAKQLGSAIGAAVQAELIKQKRPGGLLST